MILYEHSMNRQGFRTFIGDSSLFRYGFNCLSSKIPACYLHVLIVVFHKCAGEWQDP